ncbi:STAS domain-containing protein [Streptomyces ziwulingensis]
MIPGRSAPRSVFDESTERGAMAPAPFSVRHQNRGSHAALTVVGDIDLTTAPFLRDALARCLHDPTRTVDVDLTAVGFCDVSGLNVFLAASEHTGRSGAVLRLHRPPRSLIRVADVIGSDLLLRPRPRSGTRRPEPPAPTPAEAARRPLIRTRGLLP